jgi:TonB family protein
LSSSKKSRDKDSFIRKPEYPGGRPALQQFLKTNLRYPKSAVEHRIEGKVYLTFRVDHQGEVRDIQVLKGIGHGCDEEAVRLAGLLKYSPQKNRGSRVSVQHKMNINFKLPAKTVRKVKRKAASPGARTIRYSYKPTEKKEGPAQVTYSYTWHIKRN